MKGPLFLLIFPMLLQACTGQGHSGHSAASSPSPSTTPTASPAVQDEVMQDVRPGSPGYRYLVTYPHLVGAGGAGLEVVNANVKGSVADVVDSFVAEAANWRPMVPQPHSYSELTCKYATVRLTAGLASMREDCYDDFAGNAHGTPSTISLNFALRDGRLLVLADLFRAGTPYLRVLANEAKRILKRTLKQSFRTDGAAPTEQNYRIFVVTETSITIIFAPYQVGPGNAGQPEAPIIYATIEPYLRPWAKTLILSP